MYVSSRDWSSDVCSSDLPKTPKPLVTMYGEFKEYNI